MNGVSVLNEPSSQSSSSSKSFVTAANLQKRFRNGALVLKDVNLNAAPGEFISLIGPSGCGKSTMLRLLAGLDQITGGTLSIDGKSSVAARQITSFVFQDATLLPWRTVTGNVSLALELEGVSGAKRKEAIANALKLVSLSHVAKHYPKQLSGGMKMRVSIARALVTSPRLLLMDEPFGALDEITRNRLNEELLRIHRAENWTTFFVTHSVAEAVFLSTRVIVLKANPGEVMYDVPIDLPLERTDALREKPEYLNYVGELSHKLRSCYAC